MTELERVDLSFTVRPETMEWLGGYAEAVGQPVEQVARFVMSQGRKTVELRRARLVHEAQQLRRQPVVAGRNGKAPAGG